MTFSLRWWEAYLSAPRAAVVAPRSGRSFATLIGDTPVCASDGVEEPLPMRACSYVSSLGSCGHRASLRLKQRHGRMDSRITCDYHLNPSVCVIPCFRRGPDGAPCAPLTAPCCRDHPRECAYGSPAAQAIGIDSIRHAGTTEMTNVTKAHKTRENPQ